MPEVFLMLSDSRGCLTRGSTWIHLNATLGNTAAVEGEDLLSNYHWRTYHCFPDASAGLGQARHTAVGWEQELHIAVGWVQVLHTAVGWGQALRIAVVESGRRLGLVEAAVQVVELLLAGN